MTNFEKITASPEVLGEFLASLHVATGPWDEIFHENFCASCERENCDTENCPHQNERSNPLWWLVQTAKGEQDTRRTARAWRNGKLELEPGMIVPLQDKDRHADGTCNEFNVYLNGKGPDGKALRNIKRVIMPTVSVHENRQTEPMDMKLVFGGCEDVAEIVALMGKKCKLEVRATVENRDQDTTWGQLICFHTFLRGARRWSGRRKGERHEPLQRLRPGNRLDTDDKRAVYPCGPGAGICH